MLPFKGIKWRIGLGGGIKNKYNIDDYFCREGGPIFSWDNLREDGTRVLAQLDKIYSFYSSV